MKIEFFEEEPVAGVLRRSEYRKSPPAILINKLSVKQLVRDFDLDIATVIKMHIAHELFHHLTHSRSEEAAHEFTKLILNLPYSPQQLDKLTEW